MAGQELRSRDIAARHGISLRTATRWLTALERKYGSRVVGRRGERGILYTTADAFASVTPLAPEEQRENQRIVDLEERMSDAEKRADKQAERMSNVERTTKQLAMRFGY